MRIAILTRGDYSSPRILAETLRTQLKTECVETEVLYDINLLTRLVGYKNSNLSFHFWLKKKAVNYWSDRKLLNKLKEFDAIIISECTPNGFRKHIYNVEKLKLLLNKPVLYYEVYYLGNAPGQITLLENNRDAVADRYDFHLSVSEVTEIRQSPFGNWLNIGLYAKSWGLSPAEKKEIIAIVDFLQPGFEEFREIQIRALEKVGIKYISLEKKYTFNEIREIYQDSALLFVQFPEAFGLPILECLCCGSQIFTPRSGWPMAWRLEKNPRAYGHGILADCFTVYNGEEELVEKLTSFKTNYDLVKTPIKTFKNFIENYPSYYYGNQKTLRNMLKEIEKSNKRIK